MGAVTRSKQQKPNPGLGEQTDSEMVHWSWETAEEDPFTDFVNGPGEDQPEEDLFSNGEGPPPRSI